MSSKPKRIPPDIPPESKPAILRLIYESGEPVKAKNLLKSAGLPKGVTVKTLVETLTDEVTKGRVSNWGTAASPTLWHRQPAVEAQERLLSLAASELLDESSLKALTLAGPPKLATAVVATALKKLTSEKRLSVVTSLPSKKKYVIDPDHPEPYLISEITRLLQAFNREQLAGKVTALFSPEDPDQDSDEIVSQHTVSEVAEKMFEAMNRIASSPGTSVTFYRLRQQPELADVPKKIFDQAALRLEFERKALLSIHDHAPNLSPEEQERFVTDGLGKFYVSIYTR